MSKPSQQPICLLAGAGDLPLKIRDHFVFHQKSYVLLVYSGTTHPSLCEDPQACHLTLGEIGKALKFMKKQGVHQIVMAGKFERPSLKILKMDLQGSLWLGEFLTRHLKHKHGGDDALLRFIAKKLQNKGFEILSPRFFLPENPVHTGPQQTAHLQTGEALFKYTVLGKHAPNQESLEDIAQGFEVLTHMAPLDIGQAVVVQQKWVLGLEGAEGTDQLIKRTGSLQREGNKGILIKASKKTQDRRLDPPVIGLGTLSHIKEAGLGGLAVDDNVVVLDLEKAIEYADQGGLFFLKCTFMEDK